MTFICLPNGISFVEVLGYLVLCEVWMERLNGKEQHSSHSDLLRDYH